MMKPNWTIEELKYALTYDPDSGIMRTNDGAILETRSDQLGNEFFVFKKQICLASDLIWFLMTGFWPEKFIEHIDGNKANHAWSNLREYVKNPRKSATGTRGVYSYGNKYRAVISLRESGVTVAKHLGVFDTIEKAQEAYEKARWERAESKRREKQYKH